MNAIWLFLPSLPPNTHTHAHTLSIALPLHQGQARPCIPTITSPSSPHSSSNSVSGCPHSPGQRQHLHFPGAVITLGSFRVGASSYRECVCLVRVCVCLVRLCVRVCLCARCAMVRDRSGKKTQFCVCVCVCVFVFQ